MAYNYIVSYSASSSGPWTAFGSPVSALTDTITGLSPGTTYFVQIVPVDSVTNIQGNAKVVGPITTPGTGISPNNSSIPPLTQLIDNNSIVWTVVGGQIAKNGVIDGSTTGVILLLWWNNLIYQHVIDSTFPAPGHWWSWSGTAWTDAGTADPRPALVLNTPSGAIQNNTFVVSGTLSGYTTAPTLQFSDDNGSSWNNLPAGSTVSASAFSFTHPAIGTTGTKSLVMRDANAISVTSNSASYTVSAPGQVSIASITVSSNTFVGGLPSGTAVGAISVAVTGSTFNGTLALSGANASSFQIVGNTLETNGVVSVGNYNVTITATMAGVSNSPFSQAFTFQAVTTGASTVTVVLGNTVGTISPFVWGVDSEGLNAPGQNDYGAAVNSGFQATWRTRNWRLFRFNTEGTASDWIANSTARTNFTNGFPTFWTNATSAADTTHNRFVFTVGSGDLFPYGPTQVTAIANYLKSVGLECFYWEIWNECDAQITGGSWASNFTACKNALKAINPNYQVGGPCTTFARTDCNTIAKSVGVDFASFHCYIEGGPSFANNSAMFNQAISRASGDIGIMRQTFPLTTPVFLGEYNIDFVGTEPMMQTIDGAIFVALYTYTSMTGRTDNVTADTNVTMGGIWTIGTNSNYTLVNNDGTNVRPDAYLLSKLGNTMAGNRVNVILGSGLNNLRVMASSNGANWAVWLTNFDTATTYSVNLQGLSGSTYNFWQINPNTTAPTITSGNPISNLAALSLTPRSITVLQNF